jgi:hypothetical protein
MPRAKKTKKKKKVGPQGLDTSRSRNVNHGQKNGNECRDFRRDLVEVFVEINVEIFVEVFSKFSPRFCRGFDEIFVEIMSRFLSIFSSIFLSRFLPNFSQGFCRYFCRGFCRYFCRDFCQDFCRDFQKYDPKSNFAGSKRRSTYVEENEVVTISNKKTVYTNVVGVSKLIYLIDVWYNDDIAH